MTTIPRRDPRRLTAAGAPADDSDARRRLHAALQDAYLAWTQGADETRHFPDFASWALYALDTNGGAS